MKVLSSAGLSQKNMMDHRKRQRRRTLLLVEIRFQDDQAAAGLMYDLSQDGMFVVSEVCPIVYSSVNVVLPAVAGNLPRISGRVIHRNNNGFGLLFQQVDSAARSFMDKLLV